MATFQSNSNANFLLNTLKQTLVNGNPTSGTSIIVSSGDGIVGEDSSGGGSAGAIPITGGVNTGGAGSDDGGDVFLLGGDSAAGTGGIVSVTGGEGDFGGSVTLFAGRSTGTNNDGGDVFIQSGDTDFSGSGDGGRIEIKAATPSSDGDGGALNLLSGSGGIGGGNTAGGLLSITGGSGSGSGPGGNVEITSGSTTIGSAVSKILLKAGDGPASGGVGSSVETLGGSGEIGGLILIEGGDSQGGVGVGGALSFVSGRSATGGSTGNVTMSVRPVPVSEASQGGNLFLKGGDTGTAGNGGNASLVAGNTNDVGSVKGGNVTIQAGSSLTAGPGGGGDIILNTGQSSGTGADGVVDILRGGLQLNERNAVFGPAIGPGQGRIWLRDDSPNSLMFTDDTGNDIVISQLPNLPNVLLQGNNTNGTDIVLTAGDKIVPSSSGGAELGSSALPFGNIYTRFLTIDNFRADSGIHQTVGAVSSVLSAIYTLVDGDVISLKVDIVGGSTTLGNVLSQQIVFSYFRSGTVQLLSAVTNNVNRVGLTTASAALSINGNAIDLVFTGEAGHTINWGSHWEITTQFSPA